MEEEKFTSEDQSEQSLSKEEILEMSRKENSRGDERDTNALLKAGYIAMVVGGLISIVLYLLYGFLLHETRYELFFVYAAMWAVFMWVQFYYTRKKSRLIGAIAFTVSDICFIIILILQFAGIE